jgi:hypothetical protein
MEVNSLRQSLNHLDVLPGTVKWSALPGSQSGFLAAKLIPEVLYEGTRGPGKTDTLLMDFYCDVGKGYGPAWTGILFRQTYKQLEDVIRKSKKWFRLVCPEAKYNASSHTWTFPDGEQLLLRQFMRDDDYWNYHGHEYPWIGWEELCNWLTLNGYKRMMSCNRSSHPEVAKIIRIRATTNPYGPGHNVVKHRWNLPGSRGTIIRDAVDDEGNIEPPRLAIYGFIEENTVLLKADPKYIQRIAAAARNKAEYMAWRWGSWDIVAGGMFDDVWDKRYHVVTPFFIPLNWKIYRAFDWGSSKPFSVGWYAVSDGSDYQDAAGNWHSTVRGDMFRIGEWYGWNGKPNEGLKIMAIEIAKGITEREMKMGIWDRCKPGPADASIFDRENGMCIADDLMKPVRLNDGRLVKGVTFVPSDKRPGSRKTGWQTMRTYLKNVLPAEDGKIRVREQPGLYIFATCFQFIRTVPVLPRDDKDPDDVDTDVEDHIGDECRYMVRDAGKRGRQAGTHGMV